MVPDDLQHIHDINTCMRIKQSGSLPLNKVSGLISSTYGRTCPNSIQISVHTHPLVQPSQNITQAVGFRSYHICHNQTINYLCNDIHLLMLMAQRDQTLAFHDVKALRPHITYLQAHSSHSKVQGPMTLPCTAHQSQQPAGHPQASRCPQWVLGQGPRV